jgi:hypothetical protein
MGTVPEIFNGIFTNIKKFPMYSRAGNIEKGTIKTVHTSDRITCGCVEKLYHNVVLPNGDVVLCCMDYAGKHKLGNLFKQIYNNIIPVNQTPFELCRKCENGKVV